MVITDIIVIMAKGALVIWSVTTHITLLALIIMIILISPNFITLAPNSNLFNPNHLHNASVYGRACLPRIAWTPPSIK